MKKLIKAGSGGRQRGEVVLSSPMFELVAQGGTNMDNEEWSGYAVISKGLARDWVVEVRLDSKFMRGGGEYQYRGAYVAYGMRGDGNHNIPEFISVLEEAMDFEDRVNVFLQTEGHEVKRRGGLPLDRGDS